MRSYKYNRSHVIILLFLISCITILNGCLLFSRPEDHESEKISLLKKGSIYLRNKDFKGASSTYSTIYNRYPEDPLADISRTFIDIIKEMEIKAKEELGLRGELSHIKEENLKIREENIKIKQEIFRIQQENIRLKSEIEGLKKSIKELTRIEKDMRPKID